MPELVRRNAGRRRSAATQVVFVKQPARSVRATEHIDPLGMRLSIGVISVLGGLMTLWLYGWVGARLGLSAVLGVPAVDIPFVDGLLAAARMLLGIPLILIEAGVAQPTVFMVLLATIMLPAAALAAATPLNPAGPRQSNVSRVLSIIAAVLACLHAAAAIAWLASPVRAVALVAFPADPADVGVWLTSYHVAALSDLMLLAATGAWLVLLFRVRIPGWLRGLSGTLVGAALVFGLIGSATTTGAVAELNAPRPALTLDGRTMILVGSVQNHPAMYDITDHRIILTDRLESPEPVESRSLIAAMLERAPERE